MRQVTDVCPRCGAGDRCEDCFGAGAGRDDPGQTCTSCGGSGQEPPMLASCSRDGCDDADPEASR